MKQKGNIMNCFLLLSCAGIFSICPGPPGIGLCLARRSLLTLLAGRQELTASREKARQSLTSTQCTPENLQTTGGAARTAGSSPSSTAEREYTEQMYMKLCGQLIEMYLLFLQVFEEFKSEI